MWNIENTKQYLKQIDRLLYKSISTWLTGIILVAIDIGLFYCWFASPSIVAQLGIPNIAFLIYGIPILIAFIIIVFITAGQALLGKNNGLIKTLEFIILALLTICFKIKIRFDRMLKNCRQDKVAPYYPEIVAGYCIGLILFPVCVRWIVCFIKRYSKTDEIAGLIVFLSMCISLYVSEGIILFILKAAFAFKERCLSKNFNREKGAVLEQFQGTKVYFYMISNVILMCINQPGLNPYYKLFIEEFVGLTAIKALAREIDGGYVTSQSKFSKISDLREKNITIYTSFIIGGIIAIIIGVQLKSSNGILISLGAGCISSCIVAYLIECNQSVHEAGMKSRLASNCLMRLKEWMEYDAFHQFCAVVYEDKGRNEIISDIKDLMGRIVFFANENEYRLLDEIVDIMESLDLKGKVGIKEEDRQIIEEFVDVEDISLDVKRKCEEMIIKQYGVSDRKADAIMTSILLFYQGKNKINEKVKELEETIF